MKRDPNEARPRNWGAFKDPVVIVYFFLIVGTLVLIHYTFPP